METVNFTGDSPQPRFGHTICPIIANKIVLFGGAVGDTGKYNITSDVFIGDLTLKKWKKQEPSGNSPSHRAAHCALQIEQNQMVIFGGAIGGGGLADDNLYVFELREEQSTWILVPVIGTTPGRRYGHTMVMLKPYLIVFGGNTGTEPVNDTWTLNLEKSPYSWSKLECGSEQPGSRVYHSASLCNVGSANGMMVIFGGRTADQTPQNDAWGLRRHRDGRWDWVRAPYRQEQPLQRYQHSSLFLGTLLLIIGGRSNQVGETLPFEIYDTESSDWYKFPSIQRFRHSSWMTEQFLYLHGGFDSDTPNIPTEGIIRLDLTKRFQQHPQLLKQISSGVTQDQNFLQQSFSNKTAQPKLDNDLYRKTMQQQQQQSQIPNRQIQSAGQMRMQQNRNIRLANQALVAITYGPDEDLSNMVKKVAIDKLQEEHKKLGNQFQENFNQKQQILENLVQPVLGSLFLIKEYPNIQPNTNLMSGIKKEVLLKICDECIRIFSNEPIVLRVQAPLKIFGNINGQYFDLMRLFDHFRGPCDNLYLGDIDSYDYLFLGDYVDRGNRSLEVIFLLFSLKIKHPDQIHLLRGHHEDKKVNKIYGLADECYLKFGEDVMDPNSVYQRLNKVFEYMPLVALVSNKLLCIHGGIGQHIRTIEEIELIQRPLEICHDPKTYQQKVTLELLWSDPTLDEEMENQQNLDRDIFNNKQQIRYGGNRVNKFIQENNLSNIIRSHEPVLEGLEQTLGSVITIFSASDYCGTYGNQGGSDYLVIMMLAILQIKKNNEVLTKVINPSDAIQGERKWIDLEEAPQRKKNFQKYIMIENEEIGLRKRPATPLRKKVIRSAKNLGK